MDYEPHYKKKVEKNKLEVLKEIDSKDMRLKITNWAEKFGYDFEEIKNKIIEDEIFRCVFIKEPARQNFYQTLAAEYIKSLDDVKDFKVLPASGKNAVYLINGKILKGDLLKNRSKDIKSIDFFWKFDEFNIYASHKYTKISGGSQDNQYIDVQHFLKHSRDCNEKNTIFLAICDGDYYLQKDSSTGDETKLKRLERLTDGKTSFVLNILMLREFLDKLK